MSLTALLPSRSWRRRLALATAVALGSGLLLVRWHDSEVRKRATRERAAFVADHRATLLAGTKFLDSAGPLDWLPVDSPFRAGRPVVLTSAATGSRNLGPLGAPCDYLLAEHDRITAEHHFTRVVAAAPDAVLASGMLRRWSELEMYLQACVARDESTMASAADALAADLPAFRAARRLYETYPGKH